MPASEIEGLTGEEIAAKYRMPEPPTHVADCSASGVTAISGLAGNNEFGESTERAIQMMLQGNAAFSNPRPIPPTGFHQ